MRATEGRSALTTARREEQVTIGAHNEITHVTASERLVFAASTRGVIIYDALFRAWLPPMEMDDTFRRSPTALAVDPTEDAVWVGATGRVIYYRPRLDYAVTATVSGTPQEIFFDRRDLSAGAYVRAGVFGRPHLAHWRCDTSWRFAGAGGPSPLADWAGRVSPVSVARDVPSLAHPRRQC